MTLLAANFQDMIDEQKAREESHKSRKKKRKMKKIKVSKFNAEKGIEEMTEVETPDTDTFEEMFKRYGNDYRYFCAMYPLEHRPEHRLYGGRWRPYELFPDRKKAEEELDKNPREYPYGTYWVTREHLLRDNPHLNPLRRFADEIAWIDTEHSCIVVENAPKALYISYT